MSEIETQICEYAGLKAELAGRIHTGYGPTRESAMCASALHAIVALTEENERLLSTLSEWQEECAEKDKEVERLRAAAELARRDIDYVFTSHPEITGWLGRSKAKVALDAALSTPEAQDND